MKNPTQTLKYFAYMLLVTSIAFALSLFLQLNKTNASALFVENFDSSTLNSRGWYDNTNLTFSTDNYNNKAGNSIEFNFSKGKTIPDSGAAMRKQFSESDEIFLRYYVKYSANWQGSNINSFPHEIQLLTNKESKYAAPAETHLTTYIEQNEGKPRIAIQDTLNIDQTNINVNLLNISETRGVAGCNSGASPNDGSSCYSWGYTE